MCEGNFEYVLFEHDELQVPLRVTASRFYMAGEALTAAYGRLEQDR